MKFTAWIFAVVFLIIVENESLKVKSKVHGFQGHVKDPNTKTDRTQYESQQETTESKKSQRDSHQRHAKESDNRIDLPPISLETIKDAIIGRDPEEDAELEAELQEILRVPDEEVFGQGGTLLETDEHLEGALHGQGFYSHNEGESVPSIPHFDPPHKVVFNSKPEVECAAPTPEPPPCEDEVSRFVVTHTSVIRGTQYVEEKTPSLRTITTSTGTRTVFEPFSATVTESMTLAPIPTLETQTQYLTFTTLTNVASTLTSDRYIIEKVIIADSEIEVETSYGRYVSTYPTITTETHVNFLTEQAYVTRTIPYYSTMVLTEKIYEKIPVTETSTRVILVEKTVKETQKTKIMLTVTSTVSSVVTVTTCSKKGLLHKINPWG